MHTIIIGAGASGLLAALRAVQIPGNHVTILERQARVGRKLAATGNGRCNLTNQHAIPASYHCTEGADLYALQAFSPAATLSFFRSLGLLTVEETAGRCYPVSGQATSVVDVLRFALGQTAAVLELGCEVLAVSRRRQGFQVRTAEKSLSCDRLILACGGPACEKLGATDDGARFLRQLGHHVTPLLPGLVQLRSPDRRLRALKGVRAQALLRLLQGGTLLAEAEDEVQFAENGVSGPGIFAVSREAAACLPCTLELDLLPALPQQELLQLLSARTAALPDHGAEDLLCGMLHSRLGRICVRSAGLQDAQPLRSLDRAALAAVSAQVKAFRLTIDGTAGLAGAQVTVGGGDLNEFDPRTLQSRLVPGLYACGEVLDVDGGCGGYNLQWAWASGNLAGQLLERDNI